MEKIVLLEEGNYGRDIVVTKETNRCLKCGREKTVLTTDLSDEEYATLSLCKECINELFES